MRTRWRAGISICAVLLAAVLNRGSCRAQGDLASPVPEMPIARLPAEIQEVIRQESARWGTRSAGGYWLKSPRGLIELRDPVASWTPRSETDAKERLGTIALRFMSARLWKDATALDLPVSRRPQLLHVQRVAGALRIYYRDGDMTLAPLMYDIANVRIGAEMQFFDPEGNPIDINRAIPKPGPTEAEIAAARSK